MSGIVRSTATQPTLSGLKDLVEGYMSPSSTNPDGIPAAVVGVITPLDLDAGGGALGDGPNVYPLTFGNLEPKSSGPPQGNTLFEIGSVTKTFTGTALAWAADMTDAPVAITATVASCGVPEYPEGFTLPVWGGSGGTEITFADLADFEPGFPPDGTPQGRSFPSYPPLFHWVSNVLKLETEPGTAYSYSDAAFELLGATLAWAYTKSLGEGPSFLYSTLLGALLSAGKLDMTDTVIDMSADQADRFAPGHNENGDFKYENGQWLIKSTLDDMVTWLKFNMGLLPDSPLAGLLPMIRQQWGRKSRAGLGWFIKGDAPYGTLYDKNGSTTGFNSYIAYSLERQTGIVILMNYSKGKADTLGLKLLQYLSTGST